MREEIHLKKSLENAKKGSKLLSVTLDKFQKKKGVLDASEEQMDVRQSANIKGYVDEMNSYYKVKNK